jgi:hypothetical protein
MGVFSWGLLLYGECMSSFAQRLEMALTNSPQRIDQQQLANMIEKKKNWITDVKAGRRPPGEAMKKAAQILGVPEEWLLHGTGPAPTWAPKPPPEQESLQKSMDLILKTVEAQSHQIEELKTMVSHLLKSGHHVPAEHEKTRKRAGFEAIGPTH